MTDFIYHITSRSSWSTAQKRGSYSSDSMVSEGFIHCSKADQLLRVANKYYYKQDNLIILKIDPSLVKPVLLWEAGADKADEMFPHIYGSLNLESIVQVYNFKKGMDGLFIIPSGL